MEGFNLNSPWVVQTNVDWSRLKDIGTLKTFPKNTIIYTQNSQNPVFLIESGRVRISIFDEDGIEKTLGIVYENNIFGEFPAIDGENNFSTATTIVSSKLHIIPQEKFIAAIITDTELYAQVLKNLTRKIRILSSQVQELSFLGSGARIARALYNLTIDQGISENNGWRIPIKFTHQEMADLVGTCRVTVSKVISTMIKTGIVEKEDGFYRETDPQALKVFGKP